MHFTWDEGRREAKGEKAREDRESKRKIESKESKKREREGEKVNNKYVKETLQRIWEIECNHIYFDKRVRPIKSVLEDSGFIGAVICHFRK